MNWLNFVKVWQSIVPTKAFIYVVSKSLGIFFRKKAFFRESRIHVSGSLEKLLNFHTVESKEEEEEIVPKTNIFTATFAFTRVALLLCLKSIILGFFWKSAYKSMTLWEKVSGVRSRGAHNGSDFDG